MKKTLNRTLLSLLLLTLVLTPLKAMAMENTYFGDKCLNKAKCELKLSQQKLWIEHILWTRNYILANINSLEDKEAVLQRLLKNQDDIGNSIQTYYGKEAASRLSSLLKEHIEIAGQILDAAKNNNKDDLEKYNKLWHENADKIADFLSSSNPNYSNKVLKNMLYKHLNLLTQEVTARLNKDWNANIEAFDKGEEHMIMFADYLSDGIIKQFPKQF